MNQSNNPFDTKSGRSFELRLPKLAAVALFATVCGVSFFTDTQANANPAAQQKSEKRFDYLVRADFFAGLAGDDAALDIAMRDERTIVTISLPQREARTIATV